MRHVQFHVDRCHDVAKWSLTTVLQSLLYLDFFHVRFVGLETERVLPFDGFNTTLSDGTTRCFITFQFLLLNFLNSLEEGSQVHIGVAQRVVV